MRRERIVDPDGIMRLMGAVLEVGREDPDYFREECGRWWAETGGLEPKVLFEMVVRGTEREEEDYRELSHQEYAMLREKGRVLLF